MPPLNAGDLLASRFRLDELTHRTEKGASLWAGRDTVMDRDTYVLVAPEEFSDEVLDGARRAALLTDPRLAAIIDVGEQDGTGYVVCARPAGLRLTAFDPEPEIARAIIGESAAALNAGRRRGIHHGAFTRECVTVTSTGDVVLIGTGYLGIVGSLLDPGRESSPADSSTQHNSQHATEASVARASLETRDPIERSITRSQLDADALLRLYDELGGESAGIPARNAQDVMAAMAPWGDITLPPAPAPAKRVPEWKKALPRRGSSATLAANSAPPHSADSPAAPVSAEPDSPTAVERDPSQWTLPPLADPAEAPEFDAVFSGSVPAYRGGPRHVGHAIPATAVAVEAAGAAARVTAGATATAAGATSAAVSRWAKDGTEFAKTQSEKARAASQERSARRAEARATAAAEASAAAAAAPPAQPARPAQASATATAASSTAAHPPRRRSFNASPFILALVLIGVVIGVMFAMQTLEGKGDPVTLPPRTDPPVVETPDEEDPDLGEDESDAPDEEVEEEPEISTNPVISSINVLDPEGDGAENQDMTHFAYDGDDSTFWRTRSYVDPNYGMKSGVGIDIVLSEPALVSEIELLLNGEGGHVQIKDNPESAHRQDVITETDMDRRTIIAFDDPVEFENIVLWFTSLPRADSDGKNRVELLEIELR